MKGQIFSYDLLFALVIFIAIVFTFFSTWNSSFTEIDTWETISEMKKTAYGLSQILIISSGAPENWNATSVKVIGLASAPNEIDNSKFTMLQSMNFTEAKQKMNTLEYNVTIQLYDSAGLLVSTIGESLPANAAYKVGVDNFVSKNHELHNLKVIIWKA